MLITTGSLQLQSQQSVGDIYTLSSTALKCLYLTVEHLTGETFHKVTACVTLAHPILSQMTVKVDCVGVRFYTPVTIRLKTPEFKD